MVTREQFQDDLNKMTSDIENLANDCVNVFQDSVDALFQNDVEKAQQIIDNDRKFDAEELRINEDAILLIAKQQPVASDLRRIIVAIKISSDLERMADHASNIAKSTLYLGSSNDTEINPIVREMTNKAVEMLNVAITALKSEDISIAKKLAEMDDEVDHLYKQVIESNFETTVNNPQQMHTMMQLAIVARYIERFADHITNIGEQIFYIVKGQTYGLND
ncbi:phosphate signaling complex protein PhoU [Pontibacillus litoralis]|uniref:Phosphate-specific transport system accessory protein PhoU n=1 Tax=Pontibacillus litoralis JSM 072002 TaxID=1385512 RepID=A0A0A5GCG3_9BACI|nr:phosphate signaling complex protein PhoU [Pontibacillus litoralis]KGX88883.1 transcriptional regulator [Pontibacillus litoralis JSM 072002]